MKLHHIVALVTGASRGAGKGIALELGKAGATVYVSGRSTGERRSAAGLPGTIEETAAEVTKLGGKGVAVRCDHTDDAEVEALFAKIKRDAGRLDLLVNNAWGGYEDYDVKLFDKPIWELPLAFWDRMFNRGVRFHLASAHFAAPLMIAQRRGLIIGTTFWDRDKYLGNLFYDTAKTAVNRVAFGLAHDLKPHHVAAVALAPGFMRTEGVMAEYAKQPFDISRTESPAYVGRAVAHLAADEHIMAKTGRVLTVGDLAREYGFTDEDGKQPPPFRLPDEGAHL